MTGTNGALVITKNGNLSVAVVVKLDLLLNADIAIWEVFKERGHRERSVVGTEDLGTETGHVVCQVLVELSSLITLVKSSRS